MIKTFLRVATVATRRNNVLLSLFQMEIELPIKKSDGGYKAYYSHKTENLQVVISEKMQDLRRLQAQRNELNAKGNRLIGNLL